MTQMMNRKTMLHFAVKRSSSDSRPTSPTAAQATAIDCGEIILPVTPPVLFAATMRTSETPIWCAVMLWRLENNALLDVSEPVRNTPSQPSTGEKNGNQCPLDAIARASVDETPE